MTSRIMLAFIVLVLPVTVHADVNRILEALPCGIYDEAAKPLVEKDLDTRHPDRSRYTMATITKTGKRVSVEIKNVDIRMPGERYQVSAFLDGKPLAKTSHQDLPLYFEVHVDNEKYRIICVRIEDDDPNMKSEHRDRNGSQGDAKSRPPRAGRQHQSSSPR